ncbi:putative riboflavin aldehyde-forming enzyme [Diaporthe ampelina]|uniref:Putative riboflavin aldehyde-forming enzyme n=1 Tax=Diaporthe ampelina TaxID=1214573 RepID=A0A0G2FSU1_9PEZI|nr:putative riboflavin aldehyde-forming enzyme [Diaporthe ampelina]
MKFIITTVLTVLTALTTAAPLEPETLPYDLQEGEAKNVTVEVVVERRSQKGKMTHYTPSMGSCGKTNTEKDLVVAVPNGMYGTYANPNASPMCSKSASIKCNGKTIKAAIRDKCMSCGNGDIDVSPAVFTQCGPLSAGVITVTWDVV